MLIVLHAFFSLFVQVFVDFLFAVSCFAISTKRAPCFTQSFAWSKCFKWKQCANKFFFFCAKSNSQRHWESVSEWMGQRQIKRHTHFVLGTKWKKWNSVCVCFLVSFSWLNYCYYCWCRCWCWMNSTNQRGENHKLQKFFSALKWQTFPFTCPTVGIWLSVCVRVFFYLFSLPQIRLTTFFYGIDRRWCSDV